MRARCGGHHRAAPNQESRLEAQGLIARKRRNTATNGVHVFSARLSVMCLAPNLIEATAGQQSAIDLSEHDVERADDRRDVGKHVPAA